jgi:dTDP-4-dehydrorhamnose 3,5-epimerase-like enzyme
MTMCSDKQQTVSVLRTSNLHIRVTFRDWNTTVLQFNVIHTVHIVKSIYHPTNALRDAPLTTYITSYMFRHPGAILEESL